MDNQTTPSEFWVKDNVFWAIFGMILVFVIGAIVWVVLGLVF